MFANDGPAFSRTERWILSLAAFPRTWALFVSRPSAVATGALSSDPSERQQYTSPTLFALINSGATIGVLYLCGRPIPLGSSQDVPYTVGAVCGLLSLTLGYSLIIALLAAAFGLRTPSEFRAAYVACAYATVVFVPGTILRNSVANGIGGQLLEYVELGLLKGRLESLPTIPSWVAALALLLAVTAAGWLHLIATAMRATVGRGHPASKALLRVVVAACAVAILQVALFGLVTTAQVKSLSQSIDAYEQLKTGPPLLAHSPRYEAVTNLTRFIADNKGFTPAQRYAAAERSSVCAVAQWEAANSLLSAAVGTRRGPSPSLSTTLSNSVGDCDRFERLLAVTAKRLSADTELAELRGLKLTIDNNLRLLRRLRALSGFEWVHSGTPKLHVSLTLVLENLPWVLWPYAPTSPTRLIYGVGVVSHESTGEVTRTIWTTRSPLSAAKAPVRGPAAS